MAIYPAIRKTLLAGLGILISLVFVGISVRHMDWSLVYKELSAIHLYPWFFIGIMIYLAGHIVRGFRTKLLVSRDASLSLLTSSNIVITGYAVNNIIPARVGELARAGMISERTGIPVPQSLTVICIERIMDGITILLLCALAVFMTDSPIYPFVRLLPLIFCAGLAVIFFITFAPQRFIAFVAKTAYKIMPGRHDAILRYATAIANGTTYLSQPSNFLKICGVSLLVWLCDTGLFLSILNVFAIKISFWPVLLIMTVANLGVFIIASPGYASPGHIGPFHVLVMQSLVALGCAQSTALAYAITLHCAIYIPIMIWASAVMLWYGATLGLKFNLSRKARPLIENLENMPQANRLGLRPASIIDEKATPFIYMLTEAALPLNQYQPPNTQVIVSYCADFMQGEIHNLSKKIQLLFFIGMFGFGTLVWLRYLRPFTRLPLPCRIRIVSWWAYGKIPLTRQLFKLIRSTALLAFFEHPQIIRCLENKNAQAVMDNGNQRKSQEITSQQFSVEQ